MVKHFCLLCILMLLACGVRPPELPRHYSKDFPIYTPARVDSAMGAHSGNSAGDPNATHRLTYWLVTEDAPEKVVAFYRQSMATLPEAEEVPEDEKLEGSLHFRCGPSAEKAEQVAGLEVIVSKAESGPGTEFRVTEKLKPGLKYPD
jgi:hypothetical protein